MISPMRLALLDERRGCPALDHQADEGDTHTGLECLETISEEEISTIPSHILYEELTRSNPDLSDEVRLCSQRLVAKYLNHFEYKRIVESRIELSGCKHLDAHDLYGHGSVKAPSFGAEEGADIQCIPADTPRLFVETKRPLSYVPDDTVAEPSSFKRQRSISQGPFLVAPEALPSQALPTSSCHSPGFLLDRCSRSNDASSIIFGPGPGQYLSDDFIVLSSMTDVY